MATICEVKKPVPMLQWGKFKDNSYCGCVTALLNAAGISVSYEEVMGLSGICYQAIMRNDWDPSGQIPQNGSPCKKMLEMLWGYRFIRSATTKQFESKPKKASTTEFLFC